MQPAFNFGQPTSQTFGANVATTTAPFVFGQTPNKPLFGAQSTASPATSAPMFGGFGTTFGTPQTGLTFGTPQQASTPFGASGLNTIQPQPPVPFGSAFATGQVPSLFGASQCQYPQQTPAFGTTQPLFGAQPATGGLGGTMLGTSQANTFGFTQPSVFPASQPTGFGTAQSGSLLGTSQPQMAGFGSNVLEQPRTTFNFNPVFGQSQQAMVAQAAQQQQIQLQQQQLLQHQQANQQAAFHHSIFACCKFGDDRDAILANFNFIQACWGTGQGYFGQSQPPIVYSQQNVFYQFKAVGYSFIYDDSNEDGQVVLHIRKPHSKVREEETQLIATLQAMFGKPHIFFKIAGSKAINDNTTVIVITADNNVNLRRVLATDLATALLLPQFKPQLEQLGVVDVCPKVKPSPEQLKAYLENPPAGMDPRVWKKAQADNPDPANMIPIPLLGADALKTRIETQVKESHQHHERLQLISTEVTDLATRHANLSSELQQLKRNGEKITHRILTAILRLQLMQKQGIPLQVEEQELKKQLEELLKKLTAPNQYRGRLNELVAHTHMHKSTLQSREPSGKYSLDEDTQQQVQDFLSLQQQSIKHLVETVKHNKECVEKMTEEKEELEEKRKILYNLK